MKKTGLMAVATAINAVPSKIVRELAKSPPHPIEFVVALCVGVFVVSLGLFLVKESNGSQWKLQASVIFLIIGLLFATCGGVGLTSVK